VLPYNPGPLLISIKKLYISACQKETVPAKNAGQLLLAGFVLKAWLLPKLPGQRAMVEISVCLVYL
jgi:hypothetical protein